ncbi:MAG: hypothetical protein DRP87_14575 [Spirochaetes bacterium]|nr:MAG: hypothetical protein DRP87_14575 [Spirochaetota bacterium]
MQERLIRKIEEIKEPVDYYTGTLPISIEIPKNVLLFSRKTPKKLRTYSTHSQDYHYRNVLIINFKTAGTVIVDARRYFLMPQYAFLIFPHQYHHYINFSSSEMCWLFITFELDSQEYLVPLKNQPVKLSKKCYMLIRDLISSFISFKMLEEHKNNNIILFVTLLLNELLNVLYKNESLFPVYSDTAHISSLIDKVNHYIYSNLHRTLTISELSGHFAVSGSYLRRIYKNEMGISISTYVHRVKMNKAVSLLGTSEMNITEISQECGYESVYSFSRAFKKVIGSSPSKYRKLQIERRKKQNYPRVFL